jgi:hypothetical protein
MKTLDDGLYVVDKNNIYAAFVVRNGEVTQCAPILRKNIGFWMSVAKKIATDLTIPPPTLETA